MPARVVLILPAIVNGAFKLVILVAELVTSYAFSVRADGPEEYATANVSLLPAPESSTFKVASDDGTFDIVSVLAPVVLLVVVSAVRPVTFVRSNVIDADPAPIVVTETFSISEMFFGVALDAIDVIVRVSVPAPPTKLSPFESEVTEIESLPAPPSIVSSPVPPEIVSLPPPAVMWSLPDPAVMLSLPSPPITVSLPAPT